MIFSVFLTNLSQVGLLKEEAQGCLSQEEVKMGRREGVTPAVNNVPGLNPCKEETSAPDQLMH